MKIFLAPLVFVLQAQAELKGSQQDCSLHFQKLLTIKKCEMQFEEFKKNIPKCSNTTFPAKTVNGESYDENPNYNDFLFDVISCFSAEDNGEARAREVVEFGLSLKDWSHISGGHSQSAHAILKSKLDRLMRKAPDTCPTLSQFSNAIESAVYKGSIDNLRSLAAPNFHCGSINSSPSACRLSDVIEFLKKNVDKTVAKAEFKDNCLPTKNWKSTPFSAYYFCYEKQGNCYFWSALLGAQE